MSLGSGGVGWLSETELFYFYRNTKYQANKLSVIMVIISNGKFPKSNNFKNTDCFSKS